MSGSGISWAICKFAPCSRQTTTPAPHHSFFTGRMPFCRPTNSVKALKAVSSRSQCAVYWFTCLSVWFFVHILCCVWYTENMTACCHLPSIKIHVYNFLSTIALASVLCKQRLKSLLTCHNTLPLQQNHRFFHMYCQG